MQAWIRKKIGDAVVAVVFPGKEVVHPTSSLAELIEELLASNKFTPEEKNFIQEFVGWEEFAEELKIGVAYKIANMEIEIAGKKWSIDFVCFVLWVLGCLVSIPETEVLVTFTMCPKNGD